MLRGVRRLLHDEGYTIKGVQRCTASRASAGWSPPEEARAAEARRRTPPPVAGGTAALLDALHDLETAKARLDGLLKLASHRCIPSRERGPRRLASECQPSVARCDGARNEEA